MEALFCALDDKEFLSTFKSLFTWINVGFSSRRFVFVAVPARGGLRDPSFGYGCSDLEGLVTAAASGLVFGFGNFLTGKIWFMADWTFTCSAC